MTMNDDILSAKQVATALHDVREGETAAPRASLGLRETPRFNQRRWGFGDQEELPGVFTRSPAGRP